MFCQIKAVANCKEIDSIKKSLFLSDDNDENWLNECQICLSPCLSNLICARKQRMCILSTQWDSSLNCNVFVDAWNGHLLSDVTSLLTLQVISSESREAYNDWLCIIVGFRTGEVGFYTELGQLLLLEKFNITPVIQLKSHIGQHSAETDEVYVLYGDSICCLAVSNLLQILRYARLQVLKGQNYMGKVPLVEGQNLLTRKLGFSNQDSISDASVIGLELSNTFDHLLTASLHGGFFTGYRSVAPHNTVVMGVGARPYIAFHQALEGGNPQSLINDVAHAVASKIKSALPGWLGGGKSHSDSSATIPPPSENMFCRYSLKDLHRKGLFTIASPDRRLLAVVDSFGRVVLIDVRRGTATRMFKGYRNCQIGFMQVNEERSRHKGTGRKTLFLVIYIGKHGLLEVWPLRGPRVAAFNVSKNARLFYNTPKTQHNSRRSHSNNNNTMIALLNPDGEIKSISIPFHFALSNEDSDRSRDIHVIKKLRQLVKEKDCDVEMLKNEIMKVVKELKSTEIKLHCVEMLAGNENVSPEILLLCIDNLDTVEEGDASSNLEVHKLSVMCGNIRSLLLLLLHCNKEDYSTKKLPLESINEGDESKEHDVSLISESELIHLQHLLNFASSIELKKIQHAKVTFRDEKKCACSDFLSSFNLTSDGDFLILKDNLSEEALTFISRQLYNSCIFGNLEWNSIQQLSYKIKFVESIIICKLLLVYWMHLSVQEMTKSRMEKFANLMLGICRLTGIKNIYIGYSEISPWWQSIRDFLVDSMCPFKSMVTAQLCRAVAKHLEKEEESKHNELDEDLWENLSKDNAQWGLLIGKLDDISLLSMILSQKPEIFNKLPNLPVELPEINLKYIFNEGKGSISELTAIWLCIAGVDLESIMNIDKEESEIDKLENTKTTISLNKDDKDISKLEVITFFDKLNLLKNQFPHSLSSNNLIANMCWTYIKHWSNNYEGLIYLEASLKCLKSITHMSLRCGMCFIIWSTYLTQPFESVCKLIIKVGKLPREKLTRQNVGLSDVQLLKFLEIVNEFLDLFLCSALSDKQDETSAIQFENIWEKSQHALTELALMKTNVNVDILQIHYQLSSAIYYQCYLGCNFWKHPSNLFDVESQKCIYSPLNTSSSAIHNQMTDSRVMLQRTTFLSRLVQKCIELPKDRDVWIERIQDLARLWRVNDDVIRRKLVLNFYVQGLDTEAEGALVSVTDIKPLLELLVPIAGRRLRHFMDSIQNRAEILSILSPQITAYLDSLIEENTEFLTVTSMDDIRRLIEVVITHCDPKKDNYIHKTASSLLDAVVNIQAHLQNI